MTDRPTVLVTGISGGRGQMLCESLLATHRVVGVDLRPWRHAPTDVEMVVADLRKKAVDDLFRTHRFDRVVHLAHARQFGISEAVRREVNVLGTKRLLGCCARYGVRKVVVVSTANIYGAQADNPLYIDEDYPLNASLLTPEIRDLVETDQLVTTFLWRYPEIETVILRSCNVVGPTVHSVICRYLRQNNVPTALGFDPLFQLIHELDANEATLRATVQPLRGVYNVAGPGLVPLSVVIREADHRNIPVPEFLLRRLIQRLFPLKLFPFPTGSIPFVKYPVIVDGSLFAAETGFQPGRSLMATLRALRQNA